MLNLVSVLSLTAQPNPQFPSSFQQLPGACTVGGTFWVLTCLTWKPSRIADTHLCFMHISFWIPDKTPPRSANVTKYALYCLTGALPPAGICQNRAAISSIMRLLERKAAGCHKPHLSSFFFFFNCLVILVQNPALTKRRTSQAVHTGNGIWPLVGQRATNHFILPSLREGFPNICPSSPCLRNSTTCTSARSEHAACPPAARPSQFSS